ncbi:MAG: hypothetical protein R3C68_13375 [Myxococcota bacterium]
MARTNRPDEAYHIPTLNVWFALSGLCLLITSVWMVWADYNRDWKQTQRDFRNLERLSLQNAKDSAEKAIKADKLKAAQQKVAQAEQGLASKRVAIEQQRALVMNWSRSATTRPSKNTSLIVRP